ncbi:hypothetical protein SAMN04487894_104271 [Niabella drilacis]|uniref:Uncharacterized protein n=1 Tax=Niabella drilacis (strain DSM 25811 / CCM 8410 / CCUG 62505 / LMG 26954 / E90) TaxID=1285928 RepID=A0A1G6Q597_NIADE|nr:hypothetical protein SAMN04487894_104271 [Niabella drilacis]
MHNFGRNRSFYEVFRYFHVRKRPYFIDSLNETIRNVEQQSII